MQQLINMMYPSHSPQRRELREQWNETDNIPWDNYLYNKALYKANGVIAEFMGYAVTGDMAFTLGIEEHLGGIPYTTDWNYLMPVVRKIVVTCIEDDDLFCSDYYSSILDITPLAIIEDTYLVVVEFLLWYNENKTNER